MAVSTAEIAWLAGLLEGEGCFGMYVRKDRPKRYVRTQIQLIMTDRDIVERAAKLWGVNPWQSKQVTKGGKPIFRTVIYGRKAVGWMMTLFPFMGERRRARISELILAWKGDRP